MKQWIVKYQVSPAEKTFYPMEIEVNALDEKRALVIAKRDIVKNTDMELIEKIIFTSVELK